MRFLALVVLLVLSGQAQAQQQASPKAPAAPGVLPCKRLSWLSDCEAINEQARENPGAPLRVTDPAGLEFNFAPGTPSVVMEHLLKPTPETAARVVDYFDAQIARAQQAAAMARAVMLQRGGDKYKNIALIEAKIEASQVKRPLDIALKDAQLKPVTLFFFYDSKCPHCLNMFSEVAKVLESYPSLKVSFLQINDDRKFLEKVDGDFRGDVVMLSGEAKKRYLPLLKATPEIWIQNTATKKTKVMQGFHKAEDVVRMLKEAAQ